MSSTIVRTRLLTAGGTMLAVAGLVAAMAVGPAAFADDHTHTTTANAEVASTIALTGDADFTIAGAPGDAATSTSGLTAESNNITGYNVTVVADQETLDPADTGANTDTIPITSLEVQDSEDAYTALDTAAPVTIHDQGGQSASGGDTLTASYQLEMPFVNADTYSGGLTFTAAAN